MQVENVEQGGQRSRGRNEEGRSGAALCPACFSDWSGGEPCPRCGYEEGAARDPQALPLGAQLQGGRYLVGRVVHPADSAGFIYAAWEERAQQRVGLAEYFPKGWAERGGDGLRARPAEGVSGDDYQRGLKEFLAEARTLTRISHPNLARVRYFFQENGSGYFVFDLPDGATVAERLEASDRETVPAGRALELVLDVLGALAEAHRQRFFHRDVRPSKIWLADDGRPILMGLAGDVRLDAEEHPLEASLSPGYSPPERAQGRDRTPAADVYCCAATLFRLCLGRRPPSACDRSPKDPLGEILTSSPLPDRLQEALANGLSLELDRRPQDPPSFQALLREVAEEMSGGREAPEEEATPQARPSLLDDFKPRQGQKASPRRLAGIVVLGCLLLVLAGILWVNWGGAPSAPFAFPGDLSRDLPESVVEEALEGDLAAVRGALESGLHPDASDADGDTLLMVAARSDQAEVARLLIAAGADVEARGANGMTPLAQAAFFDARGTARVLLEAGARVNPREGPGALEVARNQGHLEMASMLRDAAEAQP